MSVLGEALYGLYGAARILRFDRTGARYFLNDAAAAWRSLRALWLFIPLYAGFLLLLYGDRLGGIGGAFYFLAYKLSVQLIIIFAYLLITWHILSLFRMAERFPAYMAAYNWATVIQTLVAIVGTGLAVTPALGAEGGMLVQTAMGLFLLVYAALVIRWVLELDWIFTIGLVALDMFVTQMTGTLADSLATALRG